MGNKSKSGAAEPAFAARLGDEGSRLSAAASSVAQVGAEHTVKLTHGFWLQRYSGLHSDPGGSGEAGCEQAAARLHSHQVSPQRRGILARWRTQFSKTTHHSASASQSPSRPGTPVLAVAGQQLPGSPSKGTPNNDKTTTKTATGVKAGKAHRRSPASRLLRSLSNSTSALLSPLASTGRGAFTHSQAEAHDQQLPETGRADKKPRKQQAGGGSWLSVMLSSPRLFRRTPPNSAGPGRDLARHQNSEQCPQYRNPGDCVVWLESEQLQLGVGATDSASSSRRARQIATGGAEPRRKDSYANEAQVGAHCQQALCEPQRLGQVLGGPPEQPGATRSADSGSCAQPSSVASQAVALKEAAWAEREPLIDQLNVSPAPAASAGWRSEEIGWAQRLADTGEVDGQEVMLSLIQARGSSGSSRISSPSPASSAALAGGGSSPELASSSSSPDNSKPTQPPQQRQLAKQKSQQPLRCTAPGAGAAQRRQQLVRAPSSGVHQLKSNFKKLVERQQSVDSYRIAREQRNKQKSQRDQRHKHQSNEAIPVTRPHSSALVSNPLEPLVGRPASNASPRICLLDEPAPATASNQEQAAPGAQVDEAKGAVRVTGNDGPAPPNTLSLMTSRGSAAGPFVVASFSGSITPTYTTHHLQSPCRGSQPKKYSNASTVSSSLCADVSRCQTSTQNSGCYQMGATGSIGGPNGGGGSDTESSLGFVAASPSPMPSTQAHDDYLAGGGAPSSLVHTQQQQHQVSAAQLDVCLQTRLMQDEAARRAQLAEHIYDNKCGLGEDMKFLASLPELCDITFLVGETREPVCAVKSVLAARSRVFHKILFGHRRQARGPQSNGRSASQAAALAGDKKPGSPKPSVAAQQEAAGSHRGSGQQWSVTEDASGYGTKGPSPSSPGDPHQAESGDQLAAKAGGRVSVASERAESASLSQASAGSQQPLIVGPGQTVTRAPLHKTKKKGSVKGAEQHGSSRLSRMFMKRASDPNIKHPHPNHNQLHHQVSVGSSRATNQTYIDKISWCQMSTTMIIEEFEPDVFRQLIEYIHTGCVLLQARTLLGLLNAADYYGLEQLRRACLRFVSCCITVDTVCSLLSTAERYIQYKCTKSIVQKVLEFVDTHANEVFKLNAFGLLPEHVVRLILAREGLQAEEQAKYNGVYTWCEHYCRSYELASISDVMRNFLHLIQFHKISRQVLLNEIYPTRTVPDNVILIALAEQVRPRVEAGHGTGQAATARRMTLPNPGCLQVKEPAAGSGQHQGLRGQSSSIVTTTPATIGHNQPATSSHPRHQGGRKSISSGMRLRQGSIAQVSLSNVLRLSHKFSIKRRRSAAAENGTGATRRANLTRPLLARQQSALCAVAAAASAFPATDPSDQQVARDSIQLGKLILDAHMRERAHEQELAERARRQRLMEEAADKAKSSSQVSPTATLTGAPTTDTQPSKQMSGQQQQEPTVTAGQQATSCQQASTKKSFKDFRSISRRIFMRRSSSRQLCSQVQQQPANPANLSTSSTHNQQANSQQSAASGPLHKLQQTRRNLLRIKRSDTVFETAPGASY